MTTFEDSNIFCDGSEQKQKMVWSQNQAATTPS